MLNNLEKAHVDQLKFAVAHPILSTVTSKLEQKSIRGTAKFIDNAFRPSHIKNMEVIGGPKIPVGIDRGPSNDVFKNKGEDIISRMHVKKDAIKGTKVGKEVIPLCYRLFRRRWCMENLYGRGTSRF